MCRHWLGWLVLLWLRDAWWRCALIGLLGAESLLAVRFLWQHLCVVMLFVGTLFMPKRMSIVVLVVMATWISNFKSMVAIFRKSLIYWISFWWCWTHSSEIQAWKSWNPLFCLWVVWWSFIVPLVEQMFRTWHTRNIRRSVTGQRLTGRALPSLRWAVAMIQRRRQP